MGGSPATAYTSRGVPCPTFHFEHPVRKRFQHREKTGSLLTLGINRLPATGEYICKQAQAGVHITGKKSLLD